MNNVYIGTSPTTETLEIEVKCAMGTRINVPRAFFRLRNEMTKERTMDGGGFITTEGSGAIVAEHFTYYVVDPRHT